MISPRPGFERLLEVLNSLKVPYMVGGSLASSIYGIPRSTKDIDIIADVRIPLVKPLVSAVRADFYIDPPEALEQAIRLGRMFNLIHFKTSYKFDIYPLSREPYHQTAFARRVMKEYGFDGREPIGFFVSSPEDAILGKLSRYRASKQALERQWSDVLDVVRVNRGRLDEGYLRQWAKPLGVGDLLEEASRVVP